MPQVCGTNKHQTYDIVTKKKRKPTNPTSKSYYYGQSVTNYINIITNYFGGIMLIELFISVKI